MDGELPRIVIAFIVLACLWLLAAGSTSRGGLHFLFLFLLPFFSAGWLFHSIGLDMPLRAALAAVIGVFVAVGVRFYRSAD